MVIIKFMYIVYVCLFMYINLFISYTGKDRTSHGSLHHSDLPLSQQAFATRLKLDLHQAAGDFAPLVGGQEFQVRDVFQSQPQKGGLGVRSRTGRFDGFGKTNGETGRCLSFQQIRNNKLQMTTTTTHQQTSGIRFDS